MATKPAPVTQQAVERKSLNKLPPHDLDAEYAVLGAILLDNSALNTALEHFSPADFYRAAHTGIFDAMQTLVARGDGVDLITLKDELERRGKLDLYGGMAFLAELADKAITAANVAYHANLVHDKAIARNLLNLSLEMASRCYDEHELTAALLEDMEQRVFAIAEGRVKKSFQAMAAIMPKSYAWVEQLQAHPGQPIGIASGLKELDWLTSGFCPSDLVLIAASPGVGKTSFALNNIARYNALRGIPVAVFSLEMSDAQLGFRLLCSESGIDSQRVKHSQLTPEEWEKLAHTTDMISTWPLYIDETPGISLTELSAKARRMVLEHGVQCIIVDYLQLMRGDKSYENRVQEVTAISKGLKGLAKELNVPVVALSQLSRAYASRSEKRPVLSDLRDSGSLEQDADTVIFLYRPELYGAEGCEGVCELVIAKQRHGPLSTVSAVFVKEFTRLADQARFTPPALQTHEDESWT